MIKDDQSCSIMMNTSWQWYSAILDCYTVVFSLIVAADMQDKMTCAGRRFSAGVVPPSKQSAQKCRFRGIHPQPFCSFSILEFTTCRIQLVVSSIPSRMNHPISFAFSHFCHEINESQALFKPMLHLLGTAGYAHGYTPYQARIPRTRNHSG